MDIRSGRRLAIDVDCERRQRKNCKLEEYRMLLEWEEFEVTEYHALTGKAAYMPPKDFYKTIADRWIDWGFPLQATRVMNDARYWVEIERKKRQEIYRKMEEEQNKRRAEAQKYKMQFPEYPEKEKEPQKETDKWGMEGIYFERDPETGRGVALEFEIPKKKPTSNATEVKPESIGVKETHQAPYIPHSELTDEEREMILNHPKYTLFIEKGEIIKPLFMEGLSNREIAAELGDGFKETTVKRYTSIFRKCSIFRSP